jgi:hypothetical protein
VPEVKLYEWQVPPQAEQEKYKLGWLNESCEEGLAWQRSQRGFGDWRKSMDVLAGRIDPAMIPIYRSQLATGRLKRNVKEIIGASANIRPIWAYNTSNISMQPKAVEMNKTVRAIYLEQFLDQKIKAAQQWAAATCTGWIRPVYRRDKYGTGEGNLTFLAYGMASVLPNQLPSNGDWQEAYCVHLMDEVPVAMAHAMFPKFQERLMPTKSQLWYSADIRTAAKGNLFQRIFNAWRSNKQALLSDLYVPIRYTYILDLTINDTGSPIRMGPWTLDSTNKPVPAASWAYEVPTVGGPVPTSLDKTSGQMQFRQATENDARMYPNRRLMISSDNVIMYDGPAFDWHGEVPLVPFTLDDWAWEPMGLGIVRDGYNVQNAMDEIDRGTMDKVRAGLDMALAYDINSGVSKNEADMFDPMQPRARIGYDGSTVETPFKPVVPPEVLKIDQMSLEFRKILQETGDYQLGINSVMALAKARALGGDADNLEKLLEADGPIVRDISRNVERSLSRIGNQVKFIIMQYYTTSRVMNYVGANGVTRETYDFDPDKIVPSHMPDEPTEAGRKSIYTDMQRAKWFAKGLNFFILPHSAHEIAQMSYKLGLVQLRKAGVPIDSQTIAEAWNLDLGADFQTNTPYERFWEEQEKMAEHAIRIKIIGDALMSMGVQPPPEMLAAAQAAKESGNAAAGANREGRPPSGLEPPRVVSKDGGARSAVSQSGS